MRSVRLPALFLLLALFGCGAEETVAPPTTPRIPFDPDAMGVADWEWHRVSLERHATVKGRVLGPDDKPLAGAAVMLCILPPSPVQPAKPLAETVTDADGLFAFEGVPANARVIVAREGLVTAVVPLDFLVRKGGTAAVIRLLEGGAIEGVLRRPTNEPVPGHTVWARALNPDWSDTVETDAEGRFRFAVAPAGQVFLGALRRDRLGGPERPVDVVEGETTRTEIIVMEMPPVVGRVVEQGSDDPVPGAVISLVLDRERTIVADEEGRFRIEEDCLPGLTVRADGYAQTKLYVDPTRTEETQVLARLAPGSRAHGRVVDERGKPVPGARIRAALATDGGTPVLAGPLTDGEGRFAYTWIRTGPGGAKLALTAESADHLPGVSEPVHLGPGEEVDGITVTVFDPNEVSFRIVDDEGEPWPFAEAELEWKEAPPWPAVRFVLESRPWAVADEQGRVRLTGVRKGLHRLHVGAWQRLPWSTDVEVEGGAGEDLGDIRVPRGVSIGGRVTGSRGEGCPPGASVSLLRPGSGPAVQIEILPDGSFLVGGLVAGEYRVRCSAPAYESAALDVEAGRTDLDVRLMAFGALIVIIVPPEGTPLAGTIEVAAIKGADVEREPKRRAFESGEEQVSFQRLRAGLFAVRVHAGDYFGVGQIVVAPGPPVTLELPLLRGAVLAGTVFLPDGNPAAHVGLDYEAAGGRGRIGVRTDGRGRYRISGVPPGEITLRCHPVGYPASEEALRVDAGSTTTRDVRLRQGGKLELRVTQPDGKPVGGAVAALTTADGSAARFWVEGGEGSRTGANGELLLTGIAPGKHQLVVSHGGRTTEPREVEIVEGEVQSVPVVLDR